MITAPFQLPLSLVTVNGFTCNQLSEPGDDQPERLSLCRGGRAPKKGNTCKVDTKVNSRADHFAWGKDVLLSQCVYCHHLDPTSKAMDCRAFPAGIPQGILDNQFDHRKPWIDPATGQAGDTGVRGDKSITFLPSLDTPSDVLEHLAHVLDLLP